MKHPCTMAWAGSPALPVDRSKMAHLLRELRGGMGFVFRLRPGKYRATLNKCDFVAVINTLA